MSLLALEERQSGRRTAVGAGGSWPLSDCKSSKSACIPLPEKYTA